MNLPTPSRSASTLWLIITLLLFASMIGGGCAAASSTPLPPDQPPPLVPGPGLAALVHPARHATAPHCAAAVVVVAAMPDPTRLPDREGEWLRLETADPRGVDLTGWRLEAGRRSRGLTGLAVAPDRPLVLWAGRDRGLGAMRLRNRSGQVLLRDACGVVADVLTWGEPRLRPGDVVRTRRCDVAPEIQLGPTREGPGGAVGGCGQT